MQKLRKFNTLFRSLFDNGATGRGDDKKIMASWFSQLDLSQGKIFDDQYEMQEIGERMERNLRDHIIPSVRRNGILRFPYRIPAVAAAMLILVTAGWWFFSGSRQIGKITYLESSTGTRERKILTLSDGSKITLGNSSHLKFPKVFTGRSRDVFLDGEAFFDIVHRKSQPFSVTVGKLKVQVLGTSFNVRSYPSDKTAEVVVASGKVGILAPSVKTAWMVGPGDKLSYTLQTGKVILSKVDPADYTSWQTGELVFHNEPLSEICTRLERWYGVTITIRTGSLKSKRISLRLKNERLNTVMKMLGIAGGFEYRFYGDIVTIW